MNWRNWRAKIAGLYLGHLIEGRRLGEVVSYPGSIHAITIGPNGSGKGTRMIVPNILQSKKSLFIPDVKGELCALTGPQRAKVGRVLIINPFNTLADRLPRMKSHGFNPLARLDATHDNFTDDCVGIGEALVVEPPGNEGAFFGGSAQDLVSSLVMHEVISKGKDASIANVRRMLTAPYTPSGLLGTIVNMTLSSCEPLRAKAGRYTNGARSTMDIISTAVNNMQFADSPPVQRDLSGPGFDWDLMKHEIVTVYLILPADRLVTHANYLRLIVTDALRTLLRSPPSDTLPPVLFILDEFAALGYLPPIENAMGIARGFGVQLWPILQDLNQLKALYRDRWQTFIANAGLITAFAPRDMFTANYLSDMCGKVSRDVLSRSTNDEGRMNWNNTPHDFPRHRPEELMRMPVGRMLCLANNVGLPFFTHAPGYWETSWARDLDENPYYHR